MAAGTVWDNVFKWYSLILQICVILSSLLLFFFSSFLSLFDYNFFKLKYILFYIAIKRDCKQL